MPHLGHAIGNAQPSPAVDGVRQLGHGEPLGLRVFLVADDRLGIVRHGQTHRGVHEQALVAVGVGHRPHFAHAEESFHRGVESNFLLGLTHGGLGNLFTWLTDPGDRGPPTVVGTLD